MPLTIATPGLDPELSFEVQAILDTGSDCTLVPFDFLSEVKAQVSDRAIRIPVGGKVALAVPYLVGLVFDRHNYPIHQVYGCSVDTIGDLLIVGRDILNLHRVDFDGPRQQFNIF
jgi:hypothetical protein